MDKQLTAIGTLAMLSIAMALYSSPYKAQIVANIFAMCLVSGVISAFCILIFLAVGY